GQLMSARHNCGLDDTAIDEGRDVASKTAVPLRLCRFRIFLDRARDDGRIKRGVECKGRSLDNQNVATPTIVVAELVPEQPRLAVARGDPDQHCPWKGGQPG